MHKLSMLNSHDWNIDTSILKSYKKPTWTKDYFEETVDGKYGIYIYNIIEWRMMSYAGLIAIFKKDDSQPLFNSDETPIWFDNEKTLDYTPLSDCLIFRKPAYNPNSNRPDFPFILIKPTEKIFSFIEWNATSIYYGFEEIQQDIISVKEVHPKDLENLKNPKRTNETFNLTDLTWFDLDKFGNALTIYHGKN